MRITWVGSAHADGHRRSTRTRIVSRAHHRLREAIDTFGIPVSRGTRAGPGPGRRSDGWTAVLVRLEHRWRTREPPMSATKLTTARLEIRTLDVERDANALHAIYSDRLVWSTMGRSKAPFSRQGGRQSRPRMVEAP